MISSGWRRRLLALAAPIRTLPYVFLGTAVLDLTAAQSLTIVVIMLLVFLLPLLIPRVRAWIWG